MASINGNRRDPSYSEAHANARLIAASPDLLAALENCIISLKDLSEEYPNDSTFSADGFATAILAQARAAIARARGVES